MLNAFMAKQLRIHIGTGKAGSTAIQNFCSAHKGKLRELDVHYWGLNLEGSDAPDPFAWQCPTGTSVLQKYPNQQATEQLQQALSRAVEQLPEGATALWSNESIYERPAVYIPLLQSVAARPDVELLVIAYARNHTSYVASAYKQWGIKHKTYRGHVLGFRDWFTSRQDFLSFGKRLALWDSAFSDRFRLVNYNNTGDVVAHISQFLPAGVSALQQEANLRVNASPPEKLLALYALYNSQFDPPVSPQAFQALRQRVPELRQGQEKQQPFPPLEQLYPSAAELRQVQDLLAEDAALVNTMLRRHGQPPLPEASTPPAQVDPDQLSTALLLQLMAVVIAQDNRISELEQQLATPSALS
jgi:hypothetical protein